MISSGIPSSGSWESLSSEISMSEYKGLLALSHNNASLTRHHLTLNIAGIVDLRTPMGATNVIPMVADRNLAGGGNNLPMIIDAT